MQEQSSPSLEWRMPGMRIVFESQAAVGWFAVFMLFVGLPALVLLVREVILSIGAVIAH